ncbi:PadR family transcriptional regulator [Knoellia subterranea]|uniref:PadR family transcripitonal regulator n=1 Tax=Knoellia subterranea KCTC 19937 TaxID=1385521 RepID=A0A0A0JJU4_9MICO|nr:PadR family transcriptional regulator [Knoellia subterranea]KGN36327.1 PadR family transcripitonal regulator [Knoellia subterranea KCTC 19937]
MQREESTGSLGFALLGLLARKPSTGYELARRMERPVGYFWSANHSQIYPELARLEDRGFVRHTVIEGAGPRPTKRYAVSARGRKALREWVVAELEPQPVRDLETLRLWNIWLVDRQAALDLVAQVRRGHEDRLTAYEQELADLEGDPEAVDPTHPKFASVLTLEGGVLTRRAALEWCDRMRQRLESAPR